jgi:hypothetical protein
MRNDDAGDAVVRKPIHDLEHLADSLRFERAGWLVIQHPGQLHRAGRLRRALLLHAGLEASPPYGADAPSKS